MLAVTRQCVAINSIGMLYLRGITRVIMWIIVVINLLTKF